MKEIARSVWAKVKGFLSRFKEALAAIGAGVLAVAGVFVQAPLSTVPNLNEDGVCSMDGGSSDGKPPSSRAEININLAKNRYADFPTSADYLEQSYRADGHGDNAIAWQTIHPPVSGAVGISSATGAGKAFAISGYVMQVRPGPAESSNCMQGDPHRNIRIYLSDDRKSATALDCVVVEITPRMRKRLGRTDDWTVDAIAKAYQGKRINVEGWLFNDGNGVPPTAPTSPKDPWKATSWEIMPVTSLTLDEAPKIAS